MTSTAPSTPPTPSTPSSLSTDSPPSDPSFTYTTITTSSGTTKTLMLSPTIYPRPLRPLAFNLHSEIDDTEGPDEYLRRNQPAEDNSESSMQYDRLYGYSTKPKTNTTTDQASRFAIGHNNMRSGQTQMQYQKQQQRQYYYKQQHQHQHQQQQQQQWEQQDTAVSNTDGPKHSYHGHGRLEDIME